MEPSWSPLAHVQCIQRFWGTILVFASSFQWDYRVKTVNRAHLNSSNVQPAFWKREISIPSCVGSSVPLLLTRFLSSSTFQKYFPKHHHFSREFSSSQAEWTFKIALQPQSLWPLFFVPYSNTVASLGPCSLLEEPTKYRGFTCFRTKAKDHLEPWMKERFFSKRFLCQDLYSKIRMVWYPSLSLKKLKSASSSTSNNSSWLRSWLLVRLLIFFHR